MSTEFSSLQAHIIRRILEGHHILIEGVAGSGKTAIANYIGSTLPNVLFLSPYEDPPEEGEYNLVVLDEAQCLTAERAQKIKNYIQSLAPPQIILLGDYRARLDDREDDRYFIQALFLQNEFKRYSLNGSYRLTPAMTEFINSLSANGAPLILSSKKNCEKVKLVILEKKNLQVWISSIFKFLQNQGFPEKDIKIIDLQNKGSRSQCKVAIVLGFDGSFNSPNYVLYRALSRASEILYLVAFIENPPFRGLGKKTLNACQIIPLTKINPLPPLKGLPVISLTVAGISRCLPPTLLSQLYNFITIKKLTPKKPLNLERRVIIGNQEFDVSAIYGTLIPLLKRFVSQPDISWIGDLSRHDIRIRDLARFLTKNSRDERKIFRTLAMIAHFSSSPGVKAFESYDWIDIERLKMGIECLAFLSPEAKYEVPLRRSLEVDGRNFFISGSADCLDNKCLWELKCVTLVNDEHIFQLAAYCALDSFSSFAKVYRLYNILGGEIYEISINQPKMILSLLVARAFWGEFHNRPLFYF